MSYDPDSCPPLDTVCRDDAFWGSLNFERYRLAMEARTLGMPMLLGASMLVLSFNDHGPFVDRSGRFVGVWPDPDADADAPSVPWLQGYRLHSFDLSKAVPSFSRTDHLTTMLYAAELAMRLRGFLEWWPMTGAWAIRGPETIRGESQDDLVVSWIIHLKDKRDA